MNLDLVLRDDEKAIFRLRELYKKFGYLQYKMSKFEEYDLYAVNKEFLVSDNVITFTDTDGKLMALKPDVTLSIIKGSNDNIDQIEKVYYDENVYRVSKGTKSFKEIMQAGLECLGNIDDKAVTEVIMLAVKSLEIISSQYVLDISSLDFINSIFNKIGLSEKAKKQMLILFAEKNVNGIILECEKENLSQENTNLLKTLISIYGDKEEISKSLSKFELDEDSLNALKKLYSTIDNLKELGINQNINIDFSVVNDFNYYNGLVFKGFISGIPTGILSGGQYDNLMQKLSKKSKGIGFAVYLDEISNLSNVESTDDSDIDKEQQMLNIALPKGRLGEKVYSMFEKAGFPCPSIKENNRKLIFENKEVGVRYFWVKPSDVAIYVERGSADIGIAGKDILLEYNPDIYELLDLNIGKCDMCVAGKAGFVDDRNKTLKVATKFHNIAKKYYASKGRDIDIIHLNGSIEIAPILGLSDVIVDIVETGTTLKENKLEVVEKFLPISARLISNKANFKFKSKIIEKIITELRCEMEKN